MYDLQECILFSQKKYKKCVLDKNDLMDHFLKKYHLTGLTVGQTEGGINLNLQRLQKIEYGFIFAE